MHPAKDASGKPVPTNGHRKGTFYCLTEASVPVVMRSVDIHLGLHISSVTIQPDSPAVCFLHHAEMAAKVDEKMSHRIPT